jgi:lysozyme family protein
LNARKLDEIRGKPHDYRIKLGRDGRSPVGGWPFAFRDSAMDDFVMDDFAVANL